MKLVCNAGTDRVLDLIHPQLSKGIQLDLLTPAMSLFAFDVLHAGADRLTAARVVLPDEKADLALLGGAADSAARNRLQSLRLAKLMAEWLRAKAEVRRAPSAIPQGLAVVRSQDGVPLQAVHGSFGLTTDGLGLPATRSASSMPRSRARKCRC